LCLLLIVWSAAAAIAHHHAGGTESAQCSVCVAAQTASPASPALLPDSARIVVAPARTEAAQPAKQRLEFFALAVRPPPQLSVL
jgi:hypothetical protein